jgi:aspartate kinase
MAARIFTALADAGVEVDMIDQGPPTGELAQIAITIPRDRMRDARAALEPLAGEVFAELVPDENVGKVSIVGAGMRTYPGVAAKMFNVLAAEGLNLDMITTSPIRISSVIPRDSVESVVRALHAAFELSGPDTIRVEETFGAT